MKINIQNSIINKLFFIVCIQGLLGIQQVYATNYYVSTSGSDTNTGTLSTPWKTITKAADKLVAGDTVYIRAGTYKEQVVPKNSGNATNGFITYSAYQGETVTVDGANGLPDTTWSGLINILSKSYLQISGLRIINSPAFGVFFHNSSNIKILNNYIYNTKNSGIAATNSTLVTAENNELRLIAYNHQYAQECISFLQVSQYTIGNNILRDCYMEGIDVKSGSSYGKIFGNNVYDIARVGIYVDGFAQNITNVDIYNNTVHDSKPIASGYSEDGIRIGGEQGATESNINIYNNIVYNISVSGIVLSSFHQSGYPAPNFNNVNIYNNTINNTGTNAGNKWGGGGIQVDGTSNSGIIIRNNILSQSRDFNIYAPSSATISNNLFNGGIAVGASAVKGTPLFLNVANADFQLQATSPAINTGVLQGAPAMDFNLGPRPFGGQVDIGAFEYGSSTASDATPPSAPQNLAATSTNSSTVYLSWSASTDKVGVAGYRIYRNGTGIGSSSVASFTDTTVAGGTSYNYTVKASDIAGNLSASSDTAAVKTAGMSLPDVIVTSLSYANGIFKCTVKNQGNAATPSGIVIGVGYFVDGVQRTWGVVNGPLAVGASVTIGTNGASYTIPAGTHTNMAWVDDINRFAESNENNNKL